MAILFGELFTFLGDYVPLLTSAGLLTLFFLFAASSLKRHPRRYYAVFAVPFVLSLVQIGLSLADVKDFKLYDVPVVGELIITYMHMNGFGVPLLLIIMYIGALDTRHTAVRRLMSVRKEMSIISGFPVLSHALVRILYTFPGAWQFFTDRTGYMQENADWVKNELGVALSNAGYVLGLLMAVLFLVLWVTSFSAIHRRMGGRRWKRVQRWAYGLYGMMMVHSLLLHTGWLINGDSGDTKFLIQSYISLATTLLVFTSYLCLRLRKARHRKRQLG